MKDKAIIANAPPKATHTVLHKGVQLYTCFSKSEANWIIMHGGKVIGYLDADDPPLELRSLDDIRRNVALSAELMQASIMLKAFHHNTGSLGAKAKSESIDALLEKNDGEAQP